MFRKKTNQNTEQNVENTQKVTNKNKKAPVEKKPGSKLKIIPLGGLEQIGMNITAFE